MSNVPSSARKPTRFEASHNLIKLRDEVTKMCINNFGYSHHMQQSRRDRYMCQHQNAENIEELMQRYDDKQSAFNDIFIPTEIEYVLNILRHIVTDFTYGNSIYPSTRLSGLFEYVERRKRITAAIGACYTLKHELQYIVRILPVDKNKYPKVSILLTKQIALLKGVRKSDNRFLKNINVDNLSNMVIHYLGGVLAN